jgi:type I restriction enzyme S subunit
MSFPTYAHYKDSGVEWLGEVPAHWETKRIKHLVRTFEQGWSPQCEGYPVESSEEWGVLKVGCVNGGTFRREENKALPTEIEPIPALGISAGDLLISRANTRELVGSAAVAEQDYLNLLLCDKLYRVRLKPQVCDPRFLGLYLGTEAARGQIELAATGASSSMVNIGQSTILEMQLSLPAHEEQLQIAAFLRSETTKLDALITEQRTLIDLLKEKRQAVISHAVTKGLDAGVAMKDSGVEWLGEVPAHWEMSRLKFVANVQTGMAKGKDYGNQETIEVPYLRVANVQDGYLALENMATMEIPVADLSRYKLQPGDVLMNEGGDFDKLGRGHVWQGEIDPCIHQNHVFAVRPTGVSPDWLNSYTGTIAAQFYFMTRSKQSTNLASISSTNIMELPLLIPPSEERVAIIEFIAQEKNRLDALTAEAQTTIALLQERRSALISAAVTGKIDVRGRALAEEIPKTT